MELRSVWNGQGGPRSFRSFVYESSREEGIEPPVSLVKFGLCLKKNYPDVNEVFERNAARVFNDVTKER